MASPCTRGSVAAAARSADSTGVWGMRAGYDTGAPRARAAGAARESPLLAVPPPLYLPCCDPTAAPAHRIRGAKPGPWPDVTRFEEVSRHHGPVKAVDAVTLGIRRGGFSSLRGRSGEGGDDE